MSETITEARANRGVRSLHFKGEIIAGSLSEARVLLRRLHKELNDEFALVSLLKEEYHD